MDTDSKCWSTVRIVIDLILLGLIGLAALLVDLLTAPFVRGFFCDDDSIKYPYHDSTVSSLGLVLGVCLVPAVLIVVIELSAPRAWTTSRPTEPCRRLPRGVFLACKRYGVFLFGLGINVVITDVAKVWIGRLRPHFLDVCKMAEECTTTGYMTEYTCTGDDDTRLHEARKSFPSGHASQSFYVAVFLVMYLHLACRWRSPRLVLPCLQFLLVTAAWCVALSRVSDYKHHWSDVLAGMAVGSLVAVLNVVFVSDLMPRKPDVNLQDSQLCLQAT